MKVLLFIDDYRYCEVKKYRDYKLGEKAKPRNA